MPFQGLKTEYYALAAGTVSDFDLRVHFPDEQRLIRKYGEVTSMDLENKMVHFQDGEPLPYDQLVIALGCTDRFHNTPGLKNTAVRSSRLTIPAKPICA